MHYPKQRRFILNHPKLNTKHPYFQGSQVRKRVKGTDNIHGNREDEFATLAVWAPCGHRLVMKIGEKKMEWRRKLT